MKHRPGRHDWTYETVSSIRMCKDCRTYQIRDNRKWVGMEEDKYLTIVKEAHTARVIQLKQRLGQ